MRKSYSAKSTLTALPEAIEFFFVAFGANQHPGPLGGGVRTYSPNPIRLPPQA